MKVSYAPEGSTEAQVWNVNPNRIKMSRSIMIEKRYAKELGEKVVPFEQWQMAVLQGQAAARRVLLWHLLTLDHPTIRYEDVDPYNEELTVEADRGELEQIRKTIASLSTMDEAQRELMLAAIDQQLADLGDDDSGKALSKPSETSTG